MANNALIEINGILRPRLNSNGQAIHSTEEGIKNFWAWFGDSRVVDEQGRPLVSYHGTFSHIHEFSPQDTSSFLGRGIYLTDNHQDASRYASADVGENPDLVSKTDNFQKSTRLEREEVRRMLTSGGGKVYPLFASLSKPIELTNNGLIFDSKRIDFTEQRIRHSLKFEGLSDETIDLMGRQIDRAIAGDRKLLDNLVGESGNQAQGILEIFNRNRATKAIREIAITVGADGIILRDNSAPLPAFNGKATHVVAFNANQIKSAIGNSGEFSRDSNSICDDQAVKLNETQPVIGGKDNDEEAICTPREYSGPIKTNHPTKNVNASAKALVGAGGMQALKDAAFAGIEVEQESALVR